ncbi:outer membrane beta-barrel protein [Flagellimonas nanhaiensis]|uniref:Outer membrane protein beta-barrel domain-containing protein n=1 Tax=Flagellimonas nanhaiensis TaxID=2292706 RepID=A0A371JQU2_9FLAO|nr:outer membrane beta-barrel protein [Allomuricauda nanhaiensis]RDY59880.1 hypothetical protein DX873_11045 [Allomuricauda nanhaiensis]
MGKKNLEQLFKEKFKDFQEIPDESVWKSIEDSLDKKKQRRRIIPIWWRLGGVAALLAILFYVVNPFGNTPTDESIIVTEVENKDEPSKNVEQPSEVDSTPLGETSTEALVESSENTESNQSEDTQNFTDINQSLKTEQAVADRENAQKENISGGNNVEKTDILGKNDKSALAIAETGNAQNQKEADKIATGNENEVALDKIESNEAVAETKTELESPLNEENTAVAEVQEKENGLEKKSIFDAIKEQEEEIEIAENSKGKWSVGPSVAPVYFNATGDGSPIHSSFASNSKSGNVNLSYGLTVAYDLGKRLKIRSGVHKVKYGYDTDDVVFSSSLRASSDELIDNIDYSRTSRTLVVQSKNETLGKSSNDASFEVTANEASALEGKMIQQLGYIEVPLELNYTLIDKKFGVDLIGGVSSLFLVDNSVLVESQDLITEVGEANNANSLNFSTNVGLGLNYKFTPKVQLNFEPVFKYQMNTFSETSGSFRPFSVGVYSGISFKF